MARYINQNVSTIGEVNAELEKISESIKTLLSRTGDTPNQMNSVLDMNSKPIINLGNVESSDLQRITELYTAINGFEPPTYVLQDRVEVIAHRGYRDCFPQNTMLAFASAIRRGASSLECDVQITSDGVPVIYHDDTLDTLTNGTGAVANNTLSQVQSAVIDEVAGTPYASLRIPTFAEFLDYASSYNIKIYPEIKKYRTQADISLIIDAVYDANMQNNCVFQSFQFSDLQYIRNTLNNQDVTVGFLSGANTPETYEPLLDATAALGGNVAALWNYLSVIQVPEIVEYAKSLGIDFYIYTLATGENNLVTDMGKLGAYKIITDIPFGTS